MQVTTERYGQMHAIRPLVHEAKKRGCGWYLHLENDWNFSDGIPWQAFAYNSQCIRLYGRLKAHAGRRALAGVNLMGTSHPITWAEVSGGLERGKAHWSGPPSLTRTTWMWTSVMVRTSFKSISLQGPIDTVRPVTTRAWHLGERSTPDFKA